MNRNSITWTQVSLYALIFIFAGCQQKDMRRGTEIDRSIKNSQLTSEDGANAMQADISVGEQIEGAKLDLAARLDIDVDAIIIREARSVQWGSGALGCPKPGMSYTQALVPGVLLKLEAGGTLYRYHGRMNGKLFLCPNDRAQEPAYGPGQEIM